MGSEVDKAKQSPVSGFGFVRLKNLNKHPRALKIAGAGLALLVVAGIIILVQVTNARNEAAELEARQKQAQREVEKSQNLKNTGNFKGAAKFAAEKYETAPDNQSKYKFAMQTATSYESVKNYDEAIVWYQKAAELKDKDPGSSGGLGRSYDALGNKQKAAEYYRQTLDWYDRSDMPAVQNDIQLYEHLLKKAQEK